MPTAKAALLLLLGPASGYDEQTTTGNVGAFPMPFPGGPLRRVFPTSPPRAKKRKRPTPEDEDELLTAASRQLALLKS